MTSLVKKKMNNWLAFKMLIQIFKIVSVEWRDVLLKRATYNPLSFIPVIYVQLDGGHVEFWQYGGPIWLT